MHILVLLEHLSQIVYAVFKVLSTVCILSVDIGVTRLVFNLKFHVFLVQSHYTLSETLEIMQTVQAIEYIVFETLFTLMLNVYFHP